MRVWRCAFHDPELGQLLSWHGSKGEASLALRAQQRERGEAQGVEAVEAIEIPTTKAGLLAWLNRNVKTDNG